MIMKNLCCKALVGYLFLFSFFSAFCQDAIREEAVSHYEKGKRYYEQGKYKEAQESFNKALALQSEKHGEPPQKQSPALSQEPSKPQGAAEYTIGVDDGLFISIWQNNDLNQEVIVRPDGMISFPLIGDVQTSGLTITQFDAELTQRLKEYIKFPDVTIMVRKLGGKKIIILGEVNNPGVRSVTGKKTLLEAIALCGGFSQNAVTSSVILIRGGFSNPKGARLNLNRALTKADMSQNVSLEPEDIVYVPKKFIANVNYFVNQIIGPLAQGLYTYEKFSTFGVAAGQANKAK